MLDDIKKTLWATADKLRANIDAAEYKHLVLGLHRLLVPNSPETVVNAFEEVVRALREMIDHHAQPSDSLAEMRDTLLPRRISGQLCLPDAAQTAPATV